MSGVLCGTAWFDRVFFFSSVGGSAAFYETSRAPCEKLF